MTTFKELSHNENRTALLWLYQNLFPNLLTGQQDESKYSLSSSVTASTASARLCAHCGKVITERFLLKAMERFWHEDCLKCGCCDCRLGEVGSKLYYKADLMLCKRDYLRYVK